jgi:hypothetical protein
MEDLLRGPKSFAKEKLAMLLAKETTEAPLSPERFESKESERSPSAVFGVHAAKSGTIK